MSTNTNLSQYLENNWENFQDKVQKEWGLSQDDLKKIEGSYDKLVAKIKDEYGCTEKQIKESLSAIVDSGTNNIKNIKDRMLKVKDKAERVIHDSYDDVKEKTQELQESFTNYIKKNPIKAVGIAFVSAIFLSKLISK